MNDLLWKPRGSPVLDRTQAIPVPESWTLIREPDPVDEVDPFLLRALASGPHIGDRIKPTSTQAAKSRAKNKAQRAARKNNRKK